MFPCPSCRNHVRVRGAVERCVFCGVLLDARVVTLLLGLTLPACSEEMYGVMVTDLVQEVPESTGDTGDTGDE